MESDLRAVRAGQLWSNGRHPTCSARGCREPAPFFIFYPTRSGSAASSRRCRVHASEYAERHSLALPLAILPAVLGDN